MYEWSRYTFTAAATLIHFMLIHSFHSLSEQDRNQSEPKYLVKYVRTPHFNNNKASFHR